MTRSPRSPRCAPMGILTLAVAMLVIAAAGFASAQRTPPKVHGEFDGEPMYTVLAPDAIPAIREPEFVSGAAAAAQMAPDEPVIGVVIGGTARAYSAWQLDAHEIVNDVIEGTAIAATW